MTRENTSHDLSQLALSVFGIDPFGLGGLWLRARNGPVRDRFVAAATGLLGEKLDHIHPDNSDDHLFGGLDLGATLSAGKPVHSKGVLNKPDAVLLLTMAERSSAGFCARVAGAMDNGGRAIIALDEGIDDERLGYALSSRMGIQLTLDDIPISEFPPFDISREEVCAAQKRLQGIAISEGLEKELVEIALAFGVSDCRATIFSLRAARAIAALAGHHVVEREEVEAAVTLVIVPRATRLPVVEETEMEEARQETAKPDEGETNAGDGLGELSDKVIEAVLANLPQDVLDRIKARERRIGTQGNSGSGDVTKGNRKGRPIPSRKGRTSSQTRIDIVATLRSAAPWQKFRRNAPNAPERLIHVRTEDIRLRQYEEKSDRLLIFVVDASGSAALARLAETKGAVEILLSQAYARRDHVSLIAFRGQDADTLLPPTRSLVQTKKRLAALPGGGGTPLAAGLQSALMLAEQTRSKGMTPTIAVLTDGRANIALDGTPNRSRAMEDATNVARQIRVRETPSVVIDTGNRPSASLSDLAIDLGADYVALPRADAHEVSATIEAHLG